MWRDAAVEDRDADAATGHAQLPPGVRRPNLEDPGTRGERSAARRVEGGHHQVVRGDVGDVRVLGELQNLVAGESRGRSADDGKRPASLAVSATDRRGGALGAMAVHRPRARPYDDREIVRWMRLRERQ